jgi:hypothetical protein
MHMQRSLFRRKLFNTLSVHTTNNSKRAYTVTPQPATEQKQSKRKYKYFGLATAFLLAGAFVTPLYIISERATKPSRYQLLASTPEKGLTRLWNKDITPHDRDTLFNKSPLYPLFTRLYGDKCHDPLVDLGLPFSEIQFQSSDESHLMLRGWYVDGKSNSTKNNTTVVLCHGAFT